MNVKFIEFFVDDFFVNDVEKIIFLNKFERRNEISINIEIDFYIILRENIDDFVNILLYIKIFVYQYSQFNDLF